MKKIKTVITAILACAAIIATSAICTTTATFADTTEPPVIEQTEQTGGDIEGTDGTGEDTTDLVTEPTEPEQPAEKPTEETGGTDDTQEPVTEPENTPTEPEEPTGEEIPDTTVESAESLSATFVEWLKAEYGEDYEYYYNLIIEKWGSVEAYLTQFGEENLTGEQQEWWSEFLAVLGETSPVWASALAVLLVAVGLIVGKKIVAAILEKAVNAKVEAVQNTQSQQSEELNKQSAAIIATAKGINALLGSSDKFSAEREEIAKTTESLNNG